MISTVDKEEYNKIKDNIKDTKNNKSESVEEDSIRKESLTTHNTLLNKDSVLDDQKFEEFTGASDFIDSEGCLNINNNKITNQIKIANNNINLKSNYNTSATTLNTNENNNETTSNNNDSQNTKNKSRIELKEELKTIVKESLNFKRQGNEYFSKQNYKLAIDYYTKALDNINFNNEFDEILSETNISNIKIECFNNIAICYLVKQNNYDIVIYYTQKVLDIQPRNYKALYIKSKALKKLNKWNDALEVLKMAINIKTTKGLLKDLEEVEERLGTEKLIIKEQEEEELEFVEEIKDNSMNTYNEEDDYDQTRIKLDKEFYNANYCTLYELQLLLSDKQNKLSKSNLGINNSNSVFSKTLQYAERFNKFGLVDNVDKGAEKGILIRGALSEAKLDIDEEYLLINLLPMKAEEALSLIPSLRENEDNLQHYLDELIKMSKIN